MDAQTLVKNPKQKQGIEGKNTRDRKTHEAKCVHTFTSLVEKIILIVTFRSVLLGNAQLLNNQLQLLHTSK